MIRTDVRHLTTALVAVGMLSVGCGDMAAKKSAVPTWEQFLASTYKEPGGVYVTDGDISFGTTEQLRAYYDAAVNPPEMQELHQGLAVMTSGGKDDVWSATDRKNLTYCVSKATFGERYAQVVQAMADATDAWEAVADVDFKHVAELDGNCTAATNVIFDVNAAPEEAQYLARAFFPSSPRAEKNVLVHSSSFTQKAPLTATGVLRHELGHTIGFRHEHARWEAWLRGSFTCIEPPSGVRGVTAYDSASVMHYPQCRGTGDWSLVLTDLDKQGAAKLYPKK
jgi:hypothetical protein